ncbi:MAG: hypothetical protein AABZ14_01030 [Candidatus Margulisiibacteriota bacterium]
MNLTLKNTAIASVLFALTVVSSCETSLESWFRGNSGKLRAAIVPPDAILVQNPVSGLLVQFHSEDGQQTNSTEVKSPKAPGWYKIAIEQNGVHKILEGLRLITLTPFSAKKDGRIGNYFMGVWPFEQQPAASVAYASPVGFIEVTLKNINQQLSEHFKISDFVDKDQASVWPKYLALDTRLVDKLELIIDELNKAGIPVKHLSVMCGFRSPYSNGTFGDPRGRGKLSRHMYGDAADIYVDNDLSGWTDDINHDGRIDIADARLLAKVAERVEAKYPHLLGGIGIYPATSTHGPFIHVDVRGQAARWNG